MDSVSTRDLLRARQFCYGFFASFFLDPRHTPDSQAWQNAARLVDELEAIAFDQTSVDVTAPPYPATHDQLEAEFARLFYGVGEHTIALAESCWDSDLRLHCQGAFHSVRDFYANHARATADELALPDDHLAVELAFMHELARAEASASTQHEFLSRHLARWAPLACDEIERHAQLPLMHGVARSLRRLIRADLQSLSRLH